MEDREEIVHKPYSKFRPRDKYKFFGLEMNFNFKSSLPYFAVIGIFFLSVYLLLMVFDAWIMPAMIHNRDMVKVPNVTGANLKSASSALKQRGLNFGISTEQYSEEYPPETVIMQVPAADIEVKVGRTVYLTLSKGKEKVSVPHLIGQHLNTARFELMKRGFQIGEITYEFSDLIAKDSIIKQSISSGKIVPYGEIVHLVVSKGSDAQVPVPSLIGHTLDEARDILSAKGFIIGNIQYNVSETFTSNTIIGQNPSQSELAPHGTRIDIVISK